MVYSRVELVFTLVRLTIYTETTELYYIKSIFCIVGTTVYQPIIKNLWYGSGQQQDRRFQSS